MSSDASHGACTLEKEVADRIDAGSIGPTHYRVLTLCLVLSLLEGYDLAAMGLAVPLIARDWSIAPGVFGAALAAVSVGVAAGNILFSWMGDRYGRKPMIIVGAIAVGAVSLGLISSNDVTHMTIWRFLLGMAFGAGLTNTYALVADIVPSRRRSFCITLVAAATSLGAIFAGLAAPLLSGWLGWKGIFIAGGITPLIMALLMVFLLRESPKVLAVNDRRRELSATLAAFGLDDANLPQRHGVAVTQKIQPMELVKGGLLPVTVAYLLGWIGCGFTYYTLANWMPTLLTNSGWSSGDAQRSITLLYAGSITGGLTLSWIMDRWGRGIIVPAIGSIVGAALFVAGSLWFDTPMLYAVLVGIGAAIGGSQYVMMSISAYLYPSRILATALAWTGSLSRAGAVIGPMVGGWMLLANWGSAQIMIALSLMPLMSAAAFAIMALSMIRRRAVAAG
jgi:AAHS family 4-hydroxybenzoate transporter-like MFS transporter